MKSVLITGIAITMAILLVLIFGFSTIGDRNRSEKDWDVYDEYGSVNGTWGTEIIVEYEDGTTENLNAPLPIFEVTFKDKKVSNFKYLLSTRGTSNNYNAIEIDMSGFEVLTVIKGQEGQWEMVTASDIINLDMDGKWKEVYSIQVDASGLEILEIDRSYNLSFTPSGSIVYRGTSSGSWTYVPLPNWFYLNFYVNGDSDGDGIPNDEDPDYDSDETGEGEVDEEKWIEVEVSTGIPTYN